MGRILITKQETLRFKNIRDYLSLMRIKGAPYNSDGTLNFKDYTWSSQETEEGTVHTWESKIPNSVRYVMED